MEARQQHVFEKLRREIAKAKKDPSHVKAQELLSRLFPEQRALQDDPYPRKALLCPRRSGKSFFFAIYILHTLLTVRRASILYIAETRYQAKEILWNLLKALDDEFQLGLKFGEAELTITNGKGSWARLAGCESSGDTNKLRGVPRHLVILDETASWNDGLLRDLMIEVVEPSLGDYKGTLVIGGTPGAILAGPFYDATGPSASTIDLDDDGNSYAAARPYTERNDEKWTDVKFGWSLHGWPLSANISKEGKSALEAAEALKRRNRWSDENPIWVREYLGRWMADNDRLVFRYLPEKNNWKREAQTTENPFGLPKGHAWKYVLSCDMGFYDPFALQVGAFSDTHPDLFQVYEFSGVKLSISAVAKAIKEFYSLVDVAAIEEQVADLQGLGGQVVEELAQTHGIYLTKLEQRDKPDHIELFNSGLVDSRIHVLENSDLAAEMLYLSWDRSGLKSKSNQANHHCDAFLGVVRHSRHLEATIPEPPPQPGSAAANKAFDDAEALKAQRYFIKKRDGMNDRGWYKGL